MPFCAQCGGEVQPDWLACPKCANPLETSGPPHPSEIQPVGGEFNFVPSPQPESAFVLLNPRPTSSSHKKKNTRLIIGGIVVFATILVVAIVFIASLDDSGFTEKKYSLEYSSAKGFLYLDYIKVDNGEDDRMFEVEVYYDEMDRNEFRTGDECDSLEYYDSPRTYYLEEFCVFYYTDPFVETVTFGACAEYVASGRSYDLSQNNVQGSSCVKSTGNNIVNPTIEPSFGLEDECSYEGQIVEDDLAIARFATFSGLDDGDSNTFNAEVYFTLSFKLSYECK
jgi:hypothetical protein